MSQDVAGVLNGDKISLRVDLIISRPTGSTREISIGLGKFIRCFKRETRIHVPAQFRLLWVPCLANLLL